MMNSYYYEYGGLHMRLCFDVQPGDEEWHLYYQMEKRVDEESFIYSSKDYYGESLSDLFPKMCHEFSTSLDTINDCFNHMVDDVMLNSKEIIF